MSIDGDWEIISKGDNAWDILMTIVSAGVLTQYDYVIRNKETGQLYGASAADEDELGERIANGDIYPIDEDEDNED